MGRRAGMNELVGGNAARSNERLNPLRFFAPRIARGGERAAPECTNLSTRETRHDK
jgi:hypothetical protein